MQSHYSPRDGKIVMAPGASLYARFHEEAHREQHETGATCFWIWRFAWFWPVVGRVVTLWIEIDADRRARKVMHKLGVWTVEAEKEARANLMSYFKRKEIETWPALSNQP
jgi:hypothetical protein